MKTKILLVLAVVMSLLGITEMKGQMDTLWSYPIQANYSPSAWTFSSDDSLIAIKMKNESSDTSKRPYILLLKTLTGDSVKAIRSIYQSDRDKILFTPDNKYILSFSSTYTTGFVNIIMWNVATGDSVRRITIDSITDLDTYNFYSALSLQFTPDGRYLLGNISKHFGDGSRAENYNHFVLWDTTNWQIAKQCKNYNQPDNMVISPRGNYYAFYQSNMLGNFMYISSLDSADTLITNFDLGTNKSTYWIFSENGKYLGVRCGRDSIFIWDMDTFSYFKSFYIQYIVNLAFAKDSLYLVTNAPYSPTQIWDVNSSNLIYGYQDTAHKSGRMMLSNSSDYILVSNFDKRYFYLYNSHFTPNPVIEPFDKHEQSIIYPNPSDKFTKLKFNSPQMTTISVQVLNAEGNIVKDFGEKIFEQGDNILNLDCSGLSSGIFFCRITGKNINKTYKIIIQK